MLCNNLVVEVSRDGVEILVGNRQAVIVYRGVNMILSDAVGYNMDVEPLASQPGSRPAR